jgi:HrpA-like RNA helicase
MNADQEYSQATARSLQNVDESLINYELMETLISHVVSSQQVTSSEANAILIFLPGMPEISRLVRALQVCKSLWPQCVMHVQK